MNQKLFLLLLLITFMTANCGAPTCDNVSANRSIYSKTLSNHNTRYLPYKLHKKLAVRILRK